MNARIRRSAAADADLADVWLFAAQDGPERADQLIDRLEQAIKRLVDYPRIGHRRDDVAADLRLLVQDRYLVIYRYSRAENVVTVERVVHGSRDLSRLLI